MALVPWGPLLFAIPNVTLPTAASSAWSLMSDDSDSDRDVADRIRAQRV
jgi:hypothetical protein